MIPAVVTEHAMITAIITSLILIGIIVFLIYWRSAKAGKALNKEELLFTLGITLVGSLVAVFWAFTLSEMAQQIEQDEITQQKLFEQDKITEQKLRLAILEAASTCKSVKSVLDGYLEDNNLARISFPVGYPDIGAINILLYDENIHTLVPEHKIALLLHHRRLTNSFIEYMHLYQDAVLADKASESTLNAMRSTAAETLAVCKYLVDEFAEYFKTDNSSLIENKIAKGEEAIEALKKRALDGDDILEEIPE